MRRGSRLDGVIIVVEVVAWRRVGQRSDIRQRSSEGQVGNQDRDGQPTGRK